MERGVVRWRDGAPSSAADALAVEEPLEIRLAGDVIAVTMRTPGDDEALALGFLLSEGIVRGVADVGTIAHCGRPGDEGYGNAIDVAPGPGAALDPSRAIVTRGTLTSAACGVCGRVAIDDLFARCGALPAIAPIEVTALSRAVAALSRAQPTFAETGGLHGALAVDREGRVLAAAEDIGRHNAVDKVVGRLSLAGALGDALVLAVSGRASFEIAQKAIVARIAAVVAVSAASSLAVDLATEHGLVLAGFARGDDLVVYAGAERLRLSAAV